MTMCALNIVKGMDVSMVNCDYKLPIYDYMTEERTLIPLEKSFYDLGEYTLEEIIKTLETYEIIYEEIHAISYNALFTLEEKCEHIKTRLIHHLGLHLKEIEPTEIEFINIERILCKRKEELLIVKSSKVFENQMASMVK